MSSVTTKVRSHFFLAFAKPSNSVHPAAPHRTPGSPITSTVSNGYSQPADSASGIP